MKKTQKINLRRSIKKNWVSFFAVSFIAAVSIALFMGMRSAGIAILESADRHYKVQNVENIELTCVNGFTNEDIETLLSRDDVIAAEGGYCVPVKTKGAEEVLILQALSISDDLNKPVIIEGTLPANAQEIAVEEQFAVKKGLHIGDTMTISHGGFLNYSRFTIASIVNDPRYCYYKTKDTRGMVDIGTGDASFYICLNKEALRSDVFNNCYTNVYVKGDFSDKLYTYSDEYKEKSRLLKEELTSIGKEWVVLERNMAGDLLVVETMVDSVNNLSYSFALLFLIVAVIVCYTAITRMISDQRSLIGAQKALGFTSREILKHYLIYNILCSLLGVILGCVLGIFVVEIAILYIYSAEMLIDISTLAFDYISGITAAAVCLLIFIAATFVACTRLIKRPAIELLRGELPAKGKRYLIEKLPGYKKLSLYFRTMIKNLITDKGRAATTIAGVIGCMSLLVICFSIKISILNASEKQYGEYFLYDSRLITDSSMKKTDEFKQMLETEDFEYTIIQDKLKSFNTPEGELSSLRMITADSNDTIADYMVFKSVSDSERLILPDDGVLISEKLSKVYNLGSGDSIEILNSHGYPRSFHIAGVIEHYAAFHMVVTSNAYYEDIMKETADANIFLIRNDVSVLLNKAEKIEGFISISDNTEYNNIANGLDMVIYICLALSAVMALLVLLNQYTMHINKKEKELAVMRINGYTIKETKRFIYIDNIILTGIGLILGSGFGAFLSNIVIRMLETRVDNFDYKGAIIPACLYGSVVGAAFSIAVCVIAMRRIKRLNLTKVSDI